MVATVQVPGDGSPVQIVEFSSDVPVSVRVRLQISHWTGPVPDSIIGPVRIGGPSVAPGNGLRLTIGDPVEITLAGLSGELWASLVGSYQGEIYVSASTVGS